MLLPHSQNILRAQSSDVSPASRLAEKRCCFGISITARTIFNIVNFRILELEEEITVDLAARNLIDLQSYIDFLESKKLLVRVTTEVDYHLELAALDIQISVSNRFSSQSVE